MTTILVTEPCKMYRDRELLNKVKNSYKKIIKIMKHLFLLLNLSLAALISTFAPVNAQINTENRDLNQTDSIFEFQDESSLECRVNNDDNRNQNIQDETVAVPTYEVAVVGTDCLEYPATSDGSNNSGSSTNSGDTTFDKAIDGR